MIRSSLSAAWVQNIQGQSDVRLEARARRVFKAGRMLTAERQLSVKDCQRLLMLGVWEGREPHTTSEDYGERPGLTAL